MDKERLKELVDEIFDTYETEGNFDFLDYPQKALQILENFTLEDYRGSVSENEETLKLEIQAIFGKLSDANGDIETVRKTLWGGREPS